MDAFSLLCRLVLSVLGDDSFHSDQWVPVCSIGFYKVPPPTFLLHSSKDYILSVYEYNLCLDSDWLSWLYQVCLIAGCYILSEGTMFSTFQDKTFLSSSRHNLRRKNTTWHCELFFLDLCKTHACYENKFYCSDIVAIITKFAWCIFLYWVDKVWRWLRR